jgi:hypothetical protein
MTKSKIAIAWMIVLPLLGAPSALSGCSGNGGAMEDTGTAGMQVTLPDGSRIGTVSYTISGGPTPKSGTFDVSKSNTVTAIIGGLAAGSGYMISLSAISSAGYPCVGTAGPFTVKANATIPVSVVLTCHAPRRNGSILINGVVDVCPGIDSIDAAPAAVTVGNDITVSALASPDQTSLGFPLAYTWTGVTSSTGGTATFHCSSPGSFPITVSVSNGDGACITMPPDPAMSATISVSCEGTGGADASAVPDSGGSIGDSAIDAAGLCAAVLFDGGPVIHDDGSTMTQPLPAGGGGPIASGTYYEVHHFYYLGSSSPTGTRQGTFVFDANAMTFKLVFADNGGVQQQSGGTYSTIGTNISLHFTCPASAAGGTLTVPYSYAGGVFTLVSPSDNTTTVWQQQGLSDAGGDATADAAHDATTDGPIEAASDAATDSGATAACRNPMPCTIVASPTGGANSCSCATTNANNDAYGFACNGSTCECVKNGVTISVPVGVNPFAQSGFSPDPCSSSATAITVWFKVCGACLP